jgi:hypothetical protein
VPYVPEPENTTLLKTALNIFRKFEKFPQALRLALQVRFKSNEIVICGRQTHEATKVAMQVKLALKMSA